MSNNNNLSTINQLGWAVRPRKTVSVVHSFENDGSQQLPCSWTVLLTHKMSCIVIPFFLCIVCAQSRTLYPLCLGFQSVTIIYEASYRKIPGVLILKAHLLVTSQSQSFPTPNSIPLLPKMSLVLYLDVLQLNCLGLLLMIYCKIKGYSKRNLLHVDN